MVCWDVEDMAVWVSYGGINIGGRIKQSFYPRTRHGELKVISMIYAPPYLIRRRAEGEVDRSRTRNVSDDNPRSTQDGKHWKAGNGAPLLLRSTSRSKDNTTQRTTASHLPPRAVTNRLSEIGRASCR